MQSFAKILVLALGILTIFVSLAGSRSAHAGCPPDCGPVEKPTPP
jgi:hypothetical protein